MQARSRFARPWNRRPASRGRPGGGRRGYAEKDWGSSMPESWIWTQSNNFAHAGDSFMLSVARVPWLGSSFTGFICVGSLGGAELREATYTGARLSKLVISERLVSLAIDRATDHIEVQVERSRGGSLRAPLRGELSRRISESVDAALRVRWIKAGALIFEGRAMKAGLEVVGNAAALAAS
ncbi:MAG: tocopherol cyclase family protein [Spirochaetaceae bacterium]|nr:tocopherol cyclase family protein [Spirochaetaceae bacterium]